MRRRRGRFPAVVVLLGALAVTGCGEEDPVASAETGDPLAGTTWTLTTIAGSPAQAPESPATLAFGNDGFVTGNTGCNSFRGSYEAAGDTLTIGSTATTQVACTSPALQAQEEAVLRGMTDATGFTVDRDLLVLQDAEGGELLAWEPASTDLAGTSWSVVGVNDGGTAVVSNAATEQAAVTFAEDGTLGGTTGCRTLAGTYEVGESGGLTIRPDTTGAATCAAEQQQVEEQLLAALAASTAAEVTGNQLTLRDGNGATQVTFQRA